MFETAGSARGCRDDDDANAEHGGEHDGSCRIRGDSVIAHESQHDGGSRGGNQCAYENATLTTENKTRGQSWEHRVGETIAEELKSTQIDKDADDSGSKAQHNQHQQRATHEWQREGGEERVEQIHD